MEMTIYVIPLKICDRGINATLVVDSVIGNLNNTDNILSVHVLYLRELLRSELDHKAQLEGRHLIECITHAGYSIAFNMFFSTL